MIQIKPLGKDTFACKSGDDHNSQVSQNLGLMLSKRDLEGDGARQTKLRRAPTRGGQKKNPAKNPAAEHGDRMAAKKKGCPDRQPQQEITGGGVVPPG